MAPKYILLMPTRYGDSPWIVEFPRTRRPDFPRFRGEHTCDVIIVGGGLTGCATAYACAMAGLKPIVLESDRVGQGSAGRSAGLLLADPGPQFRDVAQAHGLRAARRVFESWARGASDGAALLKRLKVPRGVTPLSDLTVGFRGDDKLLAREQAARDGAGIPARWLPARQAATATKLEAAAAMRVPYGFAVDPFSACVSVATAAARRGATFYEKSPVRKVKFGRKSVEVLTADAVVRASTVIITTGIATAEFAPLRRHFKRREAYLVMTDAIPAAVRRELAPPDTAIRDMRSPHHRVRWTSDQRLLVSGADQDETPARTRDAVLVQRTGQLMYELLMMYPAISGLRPQFGWPLPYGETADGLMYIGPHRNYPHHLFALGGGGDTISGAFVAARILTRAVRGQLDKADEVFGWTR
jgi:glycine/D-amino acid oxidase-like deaminating enzyme